MHNNLIIAKKIREFRNIIGLNQTDFGSKLFSQSKIKGFQSKIKRFESGNQEPKASELKELASVLKIRMSDFFEEWTNPIVIQRLKDIVKKDDIK